MIEPSNYEDSEREHEYENFRNDPPLYRNDPPSFRNDQQIRNTKDEYERPPLKQQRRSITKQATIPERDVERGHPDDVDMEHPGPGSVTKPDYSEQPRYYDYSRDPQHSTIVPSVPPPQKPQRMPAQTYRAEYSRTQVASGPVEPMTRMLPPRPHIIETIGGSATPPLRRKLPEIPRGISVRGIRPHAIAHEPHYPSSFHASFDEGGEAVGIGDPFHSNPHLPGSGSGPGQPPGTIYESYHQQFRQLNRQMSSPIGE